jgi:transposase-like protein
VEREATPRLLMKLSIQLYLAGLSLSNTVFFLEVLGVEGVRSTFHNWVHKADLQPKSGRNPNHVVVDETVIQLDNEHTGCTLLSIPTHTICSTQSLNRQERT